MAETAPFQGFPEDLFIFLENLAENNNRAWFNDNKARYHASVVKPIIGFIQAIAPELQCISGHFVANPKANGGSMFRIYRDIRYTKDKHPYKTNAGCQFRHEAGRNAHAPGFYVHLEPGNVFVGGGIWMPPNPVLNRIRTAIVENPNHWHKAIDASSFKRRFGSLRGESLKRPPRGFDADHPDIADLKRKSFFAVQNLDQSLALKPGFMDETLRAFRTLGPLMDFLTYSVDLPY